MRRDGKEESFSLRVPGEHNVYNAIAAIALADLLEIPDSVTARALLSYGGTDRRFEYKGKINGFTIIDDYAHHPTEIKATLHAAANYPHHTIWCVFQPHTYTRTKAFLTEFAKALSLSDEIILTDIYAAREKTPSESVPKLCRPKSRNSDITVTIFLLLKRPKILF